MFDRSVGEWVGPGEVLGYDGLLVPLSLRHQTLPAIFCLLLAVLQDLLLLPGLVFSRCRALSSCFCYFASPFCWLTATVSLFA